MPFCRFCHVLAQLLCKLFYVLIISKSIVLSSVQNLSLLMTSAWYSQTECEAEIYFLEHIISICLYQFVKIHKYSVCILSGHLMLSML